MNLYRSFPLTLILLFSIGCATSKSQVEAVPDAGVAAVNPDAPTSEVDKALITETNPILSGASQAQELETIPIEINEKVEMWIRYFQGRGRPHMERYLSRSTRYEALMKKVLRDNKLPEDLFYIALIESGFASHATSHASAVGYWQFIRGTGKRYKLKINKMLDDRRDPVLATQAAADYFKDLYGLLNSWYLSMAAYNVGEGRVIRAVKKYKTKDFWELTKNRRALPAETDNYVPKYIAAKLIAKNPDKYGFDGIDYMTPIEYDHVRFDKPMNLRLLAERMNVNYEDFKDLNPKYKGEIAPIDDGVLELRIPPGTQAIAMTASLESVAQIIDFVPDQNETLNYKVRRGDTFSTIARKFKTNTAFLRELNDFARKKKLKVGQTILVPDRRPLKDRSTIQAPVASAQATAKGLESAKETTKRGDGVQRERDAEGRYFYIVQKGDSLASIAQKYKVSVKDIVKVNKFTNRNKVLAGSKMLLPDNAVFESSSGKAFRTHRVKYSVKDLNRYKMKIQGKAQLDRSKSAGFPRRGLASLAPDKKKKP